MYHDDEWIDRNVAKVEDFDFVKGISALNPFEGSHPKVMIERIEDRNWKFDYDISFNNISWKYRIKNFLKGYLGLDFSHKNYIRL